MGEDHVGLSEMSIWRCVLSGPNTRVATFGRVRMAARTIVQMAALQTEVELELVCTICRESKEAQQDLCLE